MQNLLPPHKVEGEGTAGSQDGSVVEARILAGTELLAPFGGCFGL